MAPASRTWLSTSGSSGRIVTGDRTQLRDGGEGLDKALVLARGAGAVAHTDESPAEAGSADFRLEVPARNVVGDEEARSPGGRGEDAVEACGGTRVEAAFLSVEFDHATGDGAVVNECGARAHAGCDVGVRSEGQRLSRGIRIEADRGGGVLPLRFVQLRLRGGERIAGGRGTATQPAPERRSVSARGPINQR